MRLFKFCDEAASLSRLLIALTLNPCLTDCRIWNELLYESRIHAPIIYHDIHIESTLSMHPSLFVTLALNVCQDYLRLNLSTANAHASPRLAQARLWLLVVCFMLDQGLLTLDQALLRS
jgi:hypothetical protein